jgi:hypothetical protein
LYIVYNKYLLSLCHRPRELHCNVVSLSSDRQSANSAATGLQSYDETAWRIQPAPHSDEIIWGNLSMRYKQRVMRSLAMWVAFIAMLVFYLPITAAIQMVVNLQNASAIPGLNVIVRLPFVTQVLQGILPGEVWLPCLRA